MLRMLDRLRIELRISKNYKPGPPVEASFIRNSEERQKDPKHVYFGFAVPSFSVARMTNV